MSEIDKQIEKLETLQRLQMENARFYYWNRQDDIQAEYWQTEAKKTKAKVDKLKEEKQILEKWSVV